MLRVGDKLGAYEVVSDFKSGGMATLYLARRVGAAGFARLVAMKVIHPHLAKDEAFVRMFVDEALLSVRIEHPNVVRVEELGEHERVPFLVMEYVHGCSLSQLLTELAHRGQTMMAEVATHIAIQVADGLHAAHETRGFDGDELGVVHRDVSPQNVLLGTNGSVKVIDFGIAKARGRGLHTTTGTVKGKFRYMSPEQSRGEPVDRRTDVFALGIVLWEMLTNRRLFDAPNDAMVIDQVRRPNVTPPSKLVAGVPPDLDRAVLAALSVDRAKRPASAHDFRQMLASAVPGALRVSGAEVSALVGGVMADEMHRQTQALPESVRVMLKGVTPSVGSGRVRTADHPLALAPDAVGPSSGEGARRELAETLVETGESQRRTIELIDRGDAEASSGSPSADAIPPAVLTPSVVTGQSSVEHRRPRRRAPLLAGLGALGIAAATAALILVRPWEAAPSQDDRTTSSPPTRSAASSPTPTPTPNPPPSLPSAPSPPAPSLPPSLPSAPSPTPSVPPPPSLSLSAPPAAMAPALASTPAPAHAADAATPDAPTPAAPSSTRAARRRDERIAEPRPARPSRPRRGGGLVDGVPIADEGGFGP